MKQTLLSILGATCVFTAAIAQCGSAGTGLDGPYSATSNTTLAGGTYNYTTFNIDPGVTVTVTGSQPLVIYCTGAATINGTLRANGQNGANGVTYSSGGTGGQGVAGGDNGGNGSFGPMSSGAIMGASGTGSGSAGTAGGAWSGAGGAGYATVGGSSGNSSAGLGGPAYGTPQISGTDAGSGGGGGSGGNDCGAGGGGGGGGYITIQAQSINIGASGVISVNGGNGGSDGNGSCGGGGGGSGGSIWLAATTMTHNGVLTANGGIGGASAVPGSPYYGTGANGANGRIRLDYNGVLSGTGTSSPGVGYTGTANGVQTAAVVTQHVSCFGGSDGSALATNIGGTAPYTSSWAPSGGNSTVATGLSAGTYTYTVTDASGCSASATVTITEPPAIQLVTTSMPATCFGSCDGSMAVSASGGTPGYTYLWMPGLQTTPSITGQCAGCYTVIVTDANSCTATETVCITSPSQMQVTISVINASCAGSCDGALSASVTGGTGPYTYQWSPGNITTPTATGLCAGCYTFTVTDATGCVETATACVTEPAPLPSGFLGNDTTLCLGDTLLLCAPSGYAGYAWSIGATSQCIMVDTSGCQIGQIVDVNGCSAMDTLCVTIDPCLGVDDLGSGNIQLYPNPATNAITIQHGLNTPQRVEIMDLRGSVALTQMVADKGEVNVSTLAEGIYIVRVNGVQQRLVITR